MKIQMIFAAAIAAGVAAPAAAADFGGLRVEAYGSRDAASVKGDIQDGDGLFDHKSKDFALGGEAGYDLSLGSVVAGAYAGVDFPTNEHCETIEGDDELCFEGKRNYTLGARLGFRAGSRMLVYGKAGLSNGSFKAAYRDLQDQTNNFTGTDDVGGYHVGGGLEFAVAGPLYVKAEYLHTSYNDTEDGGDVSRNQVKLGAGLRF